MEYLCVALDEVVGEKRDFLAALAERGHRDANDVQSVEKVFAELVGHYRPLEVLVGRRDHPHVDLDVRPGADTRELPVLEDVKELALEGRVEVADLVEEDGPMVGGLELADLELVRTREGPTLVAEELALEQLARHRGAVYFHERSVSAGAEVVDRPRHDLLAGARSPP